MMIETHNNESKIIFPDYKFDLNINIGDPNYTIKNLLEDSRKNYERDNIISIAFLDEEGNQIANTTKASMLLRLNHFLISLNWGDRIYNCVNPQFMGNNQLNTQLASNEAKIDFDKLNQLVFGQNLSFKSAAELATKESKVKHEKIKYSSILKDYLRSKYSAINQFYDSLQERRERRIQKFLNTFFYASLIQVAALNLCTFVFFSWDFMEPITQCITYINIVCGYYYWAFTQNDYEMEAMIYWMRSIKPWYRRSVINSMLKEKEEIKKILEEDKYKH
jgi:hypothetical protein